MSILKDLNAWRKYRRTVTQLHNLPDNVLDDIGLNRHSIDAYARQAADH
ncbi:MAG: DUF1127 domain-containing protein [Hyphomicrobiales bacterium]|nr:DUF1127 domain-containing protein [Hyphomicrobiales bacterium]MCP5001497.1 DUF1127 domain-containing protein [Hyphomicrobiales bacterium]